MVTRTFRVPADFLSCDKPSETAAPAADPFSDGVITRDSRPPQPTPARQILEATGVTFPEGASATFNPVTSMLTVTNTPENLELTAAYMALLEHQAPATAAFTITVVEGPGELIRAADAAASKSANAGPALATLLEHTKKADSNVRVVGDAFLETKSGNRATVEAVREHRHMSEFRLDAKSQASILQETQQAGLALEIEPTVGADRSTVEITYALSLNPVPPVQRQVSVNDPFTANMAEFPVTDVPGAQFVSGISTTTGHTKLIGITKPAGTPKADTDTLWAVFLTTTLRRVEALPAPQPKVAAPAPTTVPPGMIFAALPVPDGLFTWVLSWPRAITLQSWLSQAGITFPVGASTVQKGGVLHVINTPENIGLIAAVVEHELGHRASTVAFTLHTLEAPAALLRDLTRQTLATADDAAMLAAVEAAAAKGEARFISSAFIETKPGTRAVHDAAQEHVYLENFHTDDKGHAISGFETRRVGSHLEIEPTLRPDNRTVEVTFSHELHPTAPVLRHDAFRDPATQQRFELPLTDFHLHTTTTSLSVSKGGTKLISLNAPTGRANDGVLWATFLKCDVVPHVAAPRHTGHDPAPELQQAADPKTWNTRTFRVPPDFLSIGGEETAPGTVPADPFAVSPPAAGDRPKMHRKSAKQILEAQGVLFPEGATVSFNPALGTLFVRNTNENLDLMEAFVDGWCCRLPPKNVAFTTHVLQGPGSLLRRLTAQAAPKSDHRAELDELLAAVKAGTVQHLDTARIETKSGTRATSQQGMQHRAIAKVSVNDKHEPLILQEKRRVGLQVELEPTVGADGITVELTLAPEFHTAPPSEHRERLIDTQGRRHEFPLTDYHTANVTTGLSVIDGSVRLLSLYKPAGKPEFEKGDVLQVMFITCDLVGSRE